MKRQGFCLTCNNLYLLCENNHKEHKEIKQDISLQKYLLKHQTLLKISLLYNIKKTRNREFSC